MSSITSKYMTKQSPDVTDTDLIPYIDVTVTDLKHYREEGSGETI